MVLVISDSDGIYHQAWANFISKIPSSESPTDHILIRDQELTKYHAVLKWQDHNFCYFYLEFDTAADYAAFVLKYS